MSAKPGQALILEEPFTAEELEDMGFLEPRRTSVRGRAPIDPARKALVERIVDQIDIGTNDRRTVVLLGMRILNEVRAGQAKEVAEETARIRQRLQASIQRNKALSEELEHMRASPTYNRAELKYISRMHGLGLSYQQLAELLGGTAEQVQQAHDGFKFELSGKADGQVRFALIRDPEKPTQRGRRLET